MVQKATTAAGSSVDVWPKTVTDDVKYLQTAMVNVCLVGPSENGDRGWCLVDTGMPFYTQTIIDTAERVYGRGARPFAIILTHGHFDHVGCVQELATRWDVPVFAHRLELPYLTGQSAYPPPDPTVGGGLMASLSWLYPRQPIDLGSRIEELPSDGTVPGMPGWRWIHTPGHSPGHISLFRNRDRTLIAGDAFVTVKQESLIAVMTQFPEIKGPPAYFTTDWDAARQSVEHLAALDPEIAITGHGVPLDGEALRLGLDYLTKNFATCGRPSYGRYVRYPAISDQRGVVSVPADVPHPVRNFLAGAALGLFASCFAGSLFGTRGHT